MTCVPIREAELGRRAGDVLERMGERAGEVILDDRVYKGLISFLGSTLYSYQLIIRLFNSPQDTKVLVTL